MADLLDDLVFPERPRRGGFGQVGFHQLGVQGNGLVGAFQGLVVAPHSARQPGEAQPAERVAGIGLQGLLQTVEPLLWQPHFLE
jgi:hypothetical protein